MKMRTKPRASWLYAVVLGAFSLAAQAQDATLGANVDSLLDFARSRNPEYASMRYEADAAAEQMLNRFDRNTPEQLKTALTLFLTLPAVPILYYGEEIGMRNLEDAPVKEGSYTSRNRSSCRTDYSR